MGSEIVRVGWCMYVCVVSLDYLFLWQVHVSVYCASQIFVQSCCTLLISASYSVCLWQISQIQTCLFVVAVFFVNLFSTLYGCYEKDRCIISCPTTCYVNCDSEISSTSPSLIISFTTYYSFRALKRYWNTCLCLYPFIVLQISFPDVYRIQTGTFFSLMIEFILMPTRLFCSHIFDDSVFNTLSDTIDVYVITLSPSFTIKCLGLLSILYKGFLVRFTPLLYQCTIFACNFVSPIQTIQLLNQQRPHSSVRI